jgi:hypothetical protein
MEIKSKIFYILAASVFLFAIFFLPGNIKMLALQPVFGYDGGGGGGGGIFFPSLALPAGGFSIVINNGAAETDSRNAALVLNGGSDAAKMVISNFSDFRDAQSKTYQTTYAWVLSEGEGQKNVYAKFYNNWGQSSNVVSDGINLVSFPVPPPLSLEAQKADANKDNKIDILDFNTLIVNWGTAVSGNIADFNGDNIVDLFDFNFLMIYWTG